jgi:hypothetical protein
MLPLDKAQTNYSQNSFFTELVNLPWKIIAHVVGGVAFQTSGTYAPRLFMEASHLNGCTFNMGANVNDYFKHCKYHYPKLEIKSEKEQEQFYANYAAAQEETGRLLTSQLSDFLCLQEVVDMERPLIKSLEKKGFQVFHFEGNPTFDNVIALNQSRFKDITNHSIDVDISDTFKKDATIVTATDIVTGQRMTFVSAHVPGIDLAKSAIDGNEAAAGDNYCSAIVHKLSKIATGTIQIIGADMNANPEKWNPWFEIFAKQGFQVLRSNSSTNVNPNDSEYQEREIDFMFAKTSSIWQQTKSIVCSTFENKVKLISDRPFGWNTSQNASDHLPVFINISTRLNASKAYQLWKSIYQLCLSSIYPKQPSIKIS